MANRFKCNSINTSFNDKVAVFCSKAVDQFKTTLLVEIFLLNVANFTGNTFKVP